jgi:RNA processing factor Prp31
MGIKQKIDEYIKRAIYSFMLNEIYSTKFPEINTTIDDKESAQILLAKWNSRTDKPSTEDFLAQLQKEYPAIGTIRSKLKEDLEERIINGLIIRIERNTVKN